MRPSRREFVKWVTASGMALSLSRLGSAEEAGFAARETLPGRQGWNPAATGVGRIDGVVKVTGTKLYASDFRAADLPGYQLIERKRQIEHALYLRLRDLFSLQVDMVFYDLTSTYFEGKGPPEIGANGHSRDGKPRNPQVLVGLVMVDGWPIAHHVFEGNRRDAMTVSDVVIDLERRFGLKRIVFVGDRGMVTSQNLDDLRGSGHGYIVGRNRRRSGE